jgi:hypothetical protein
MFARQCKRALQQANGPLHVGIRTQIHADPAGIRQDVMRFGVTGGYQGVAHRLRKRNIHQRIAVHVPNFAAAQAEFDASVAMRRGRHAFPPAGSLANTAFRSRDGHDADILAHRRP